LKILPASDTLQKQGTFTFKRVTPEDLPTLYQWFKEPHVQQWWPVPKNDEFFDFFLKRIRSKDTFAYLAMMDGTPIGYIQYYYIDRNNPKAGSWLPELPEATVGTDQFIGDPAYIGKGYGTQMVKAFIQYLTHILEPHITTVIVDPDPANHAAIRCYEKVGFKKELVYTVSGGQHLLMRCDICKSTGTNL